MKCFFSQGWPKFVRDNTLNDGDFLTFAYNGAHIFEVSIFRGYDACKEISEVTELEEEEEDSVISLSSEDTDTGAKSEMKNTVPEGRDKGKSKVEVVEDSDDDEEEDSVYSESSEETETDTDSEFKVAKPTIPKSQKKGKKKEQVVESSDDEEDEEEDSDSDYIETFGQLDIEENSISEEDSSYAPDKEDTATASFVKPKVANKVANLKRKEAAKKRKKVDPMIKNPERYLDDPKNIHFETNVKNRLYELLVHAQLVKDYCLRFGDYVNYIDRFGKLSAKTAKWKDQRVCIKRWMRICKRNKLKKEDRILCELLRKGTFVYAIKLHVIRGKDL